MIANNNNNQEDPNFERRLNEATAGLDRYVRKHLLEKISRVNASAVVDYIEARKSEVNPKDESRQGVIMTLKQLSEFHKNVKSFRDDP